MDGNKDEALKCLKIGKEALKSGDRARALKCITKARRLDPTLHVDDLLSKIKSKPNTQNNGSTPNASTSKKPSPSAANGPASPSSAAAYSQDQIAIVREIMKKKCYYEVLGLEKSCTVEDVRKAYKKLSLKVHPDKNKASGAEDAFKAVLKAFQCLSNDQSRRNGDATASKEPVHEQRASEEPASRQDTGNGDAAAASEEPVHEQRAYEESASRQDTGTGGRQRNAEKGPGVSGLILLMVPVVVVLFLNFWSSSKPICSSQEEYPYEPSPADLEEYPYEPSPADFWFWN